MGVGVGRIVKLEGCKAGLVLVAGWMAWVGQDD